MRARRWLGKVFLVGGLLAEVLVLLLLAVVLFVRPADLADVTDPLHVTFAVRDGISWPVICRAGGLLLLSDSSSGTQSVRIGRAADYAIYAYDLDTPEPVILRFGGQPGSEHRVKTLSDMLRKSDRPQ